MRPEKPLAIVLAAVLSLPLALSAQEMPVFTGKGKVTEAINGKTGAIFDIGKGVTMLFPRGLPVGSSRLVTLEKSRKRPTPKQIHAKFSKVGNALNFTGAFNASDKPIEVAMKFKKEPKKKGMKLVLAMEVGTFCNDSNKRYKLKGSLCSGWEFNDAHYDGGRIVARVQSTGGMRMQFGFIPEDDGQGADGE